MKDWLFLLFIDQIFVEMSKDFETSNLISNRFCWYVPIPKWLVECDRRALLYLKRRIEIFFVKTQLALMGSNSASSWKKNREANICPTKWKKWHLRPISWEKLPSILKVWPWLRKKEKPIKKELFRHTSCRQTFAFFYWKRFF